MVEGYFDVIGLWRKGIKNVVAIMGTAPQPWQFVILSRHARQVAIAFDGDAAGEKAVTKASDLARACDMVPARILIPHGLDPDEFVLQKGKRKFLELVQAAFE